MLEAENKQIFATKEYIKLEKEYLFLLQQVIQCKKDLERQEELHSKKMVPKIDYDNKKTQSLIRLQELSINEAKQKVVYHQIIEYRLKIRFKGTDEDCRLLMAENTLGLIESLIVYHKAIIQKIDYQLSFEQQIFNAYNNFDIYQETAEYCRLNKLKLTNEKIQYETFIEFLQNNLIKIKQTIHRLKLLSKEQ